MLYELLSNTGFFLTPAAEKTKTQEKNSSQKLKEKTQHLGGFSLQFRKLKKKTEFSSQNSKLLKGGTFYAIFIAKFFQKVEVRKPFAKNLKDIRKKLGKCRKNSRKNSKLKGKTQNSRKKLNVSEDCPSSDLPSDVKKKACLIVSGNKKNYFWK